jgi:7-cyano-7-deazaguanine synthase
MEKCIIPVSGGIDSTVILHWIASEGKEVHAVSYNYGQKHFEREMECALYNCRDVCESHKVINLNFFKEIVNTSALLNDNIDVAKAKDVIGDPQTVNYVPNRNMMMLSICTAYAESIGATQVYHGAALVDSQAGFWDGSAEFLRAINNVNSLNRRERVEILAPLITKSKKSIIEKGLEVGVDFSKTWTCYEGKQRACGECTACSSRIQGFIDAGFRDPISYERDIPWNDFNVKEI